MGNFICPRCGSKHYRKHGKGWCGGHRIQKLQCTSCGRIVNTGTVIREPKAKYFPETG